MTEIVEPGVLDHKPRRKLKLKISDIVIFGIMLIVIVVLVITLIGKLHLKHDVTGARTVSDKVIADIAKRDGAAVYKLGSSKFQSGYSAKTLTNQFVSIESVTLGKAVIDKQTVSTTRSGTTVYIIYKYPARLAGLPYYIRVAAMQTHGKWQLTNISGSANESNLIVQ